MVKPPNDQTKDISVAAGNPELWMIKEVAVAQSILMIYALPNQACVHLTAGTSLLTKAAMPVRKIRYANTMWAK